MNRRATGYMAEQTAVRRLEKCGYRIIGRNVKCGGVEVDVIAEEGGDLVFVEVKSSETDFASPAERVTSRQMARYVRAAKAYVQSRNLFGVNVRFDIAEVTPAGVGIIKHAFDASCR